MLRLETKYFGFQEGIFHDSLLRLKYLLNDISNCKVILEMKIQNSFFFLALLAVLMTTAMAANTTDIIAPVQQQINQAQGDLQQKVVQHIAEGNLTPEHLQKDVNATKEELTKKATEIKQNASVTQQQLQQKAKEEVKNQVNQVNQKVQQPGFEATLAAAGILASAYILRRRD